jgi:hypothetical protein
VGSLIAQAWATDVGKLCLSGVGLAIASSVVPGVLGFFNVRGQILNGVRMAFELGAGASVVSATFLAGSRLINLVLGR